MSNGDRYYPKQRMSEAFRHSREATRATPLYKLAVPDARAQARERVRTGDWPAFSLRNQRVDERNDLRARNDLEYQSRRFSRAARVMSQRTQRRDTRTTKRK